MSRWLLEIWLPWIKGEDKITIWLTGSQGSPGLSRFTWSYLWHCSQKISNYHVWQWWFLEGSFNGSWILAGNWKVDCWIPWKFDVAADKYMMGFANCDWSTPRWRSSDRKGTLVDLCRCRLVLSGVCSCSLLLLSWPQPNALLLPGKRHPTILETSLVGWLVSWLVVWLVGSVVGYLLPSSGRPLLGCWVGRSVSLLVVESVFRCASIS